MADWNCYRCTFINKGSEKYCAICTSPHLHRVDNQSLEFYTYDKKEKVDNGRGYECSCEERRLLLIGKTGSGKSLTGNTILGDHHFDSIIFGKANTKTCKRGESMRFGKKLVVVDTPGLFDSIIDDDLVKDEIHKCMTLTSPVPHAIILVVQVGRFSKAEKDYVNKIIEVLGEKMYHSLVVVFTRRDDLERERISLDHFVHNAPKGLKQILDKCKQRYLAIDNMSSCETKERDVQCLLQMIDKLHVLRKREEIQNQKAEKVSYNSIGWKQWTEDENLYKEQWTEDENLHKDRERLYNVQYQSALTTCIDAANQQNYPAERENIISKNICTTHRRVNDHKLKALKETEVQLRKQVEERKKYVLIQQDIDNELMRLNFQYMMQRQQLDEEQENGMGLEHLDGKLKSKRKKNTVFRRERNIDTSISISNNENEADMALSQKENDLNTSEVDENCRSHREYKRFPKPLRRVTQSCAIS